jgi:hypothetical protein
MGEGILKKALPLIENLDEQFFGRCNQVTLLAELKLLHDKV